MYIVDGQYFELTLKQKLFFFIISLVINAFGNGLSVATAMGSAPWTAAGANLSNATQWPISVFLAIIAVSIALINMILLRKIDWPRFFGNIIFGLSFSWLVGVFSKLFIAYGIQNISWTLRLPIDIFAVFLIGVAISIYQRANWIMHPLDDLTNILRFNYFFGNASKAQMSNFVIAITLSLIAFLFSHQLVALGVGTVFSFLLQGHNIAWTDRHLFKRLVHGDVYKKEA